MPDSVEQTRLVGLYEQLRLKLLDLSRKNRMLNYGIGGGRSRRHLQIVDVSLEDAYTKLVGEESRLRIGFLPDPPEQLPEEKTEDFLAALEYAKVSDFEYLKKLDELENEGRDDDIEITRLERHLRDKVRAQLALPPRPTRIDVNKAEHARSQGIDPALELSGSRAIGGRESNSLQTLLYADELERVIDKVASQARLAEQELGVSTLFLAFGFLEWYESDDSDKRSYAPLLLVPVSIEIEKVRGKQVHYVMAREGEAETNLSLQKLLEQNFKRELANFEIGDGEEIGSVEKYLILAGEAVDGLKRWRIHRWLVLGHFAFGRFVIYSDLKFENWKQHPVDHPIVKALLSGTERRSDESTFMSAPSDYLIDDPEIEKFAPFLIQDADASQHSALVDAMQGKNLVIQGPPGTGKSQTITNIIANALAQDKRVLFLSEKQAALDVVKRRLDNAGLGDFCLELHSDKASPKVVVESIKKRADLGVGVRQRSSPNATTIDDVLRNESRIAIKRYLTELHADGPTNTTPFALIWKSLRGRSEHGDLVETFKVVPIPRNLLTDPVKLGQVHSRIDHLAEVSAKFVEAFGSPSQSPWASIEFPKLEGQEIGNLVSHLRDLRDIGVTLTRYFGRYAEVLSFSAIGEIEELSHLDTVIGDPPDGAPIAIVAKLDARDLSRGLQDQRSLVELNELLSHMPTMTDADSHHFAIAQALLASAPEPLIQMSPANAYAVARRTNDRLSALIVAIDGCLPILGILSLESNLPTNALQAVATVAIAFSRLPTQEREWISVLVEVSDHDFSIALSRWRRLSKKETDWRRKFAQHGDRPWPSAEDLKTAAKTLRKSGVGVFVSAINGTRRTARDLTNRLGVQASDGVAEDILQLAHHAEEVVHFNSDEGHSRLLGKLWMGLESPFEEIAAGANARADIAKQLNSFPDGARVLQQLSSLSSSVSRDLDKYAPIARSLLVHKDALEGHDQPVDVMLSEGRREQQRLTNFLLLDQAEVLSDFDIPIQQFAEIASLRARKAAIEKKLSESPILQAIRSLGATLSDIDLAERAIHWVAQVKHATQSRARQDALTSNEVHEIRQILRKAAEEGAEPLAAYKAIASLISREFGIVQFDNLTPSELTNCLERLIEHRSELRDLLGIRNIRRELAGVGLNDFLKRFDQLTLAPDQMPGIFEALCVQRQTDLALRASSELGRYSGAELEAHRRTFAERDRAKIAADRKTIAARLLQNVPPPGSDLGPRRGWTGTAMLRNEFPKQRRFTPVRGLLARAGNAIQSLKPCFMMSPLSLAKFSQPDALVFDILLIDEASQMKPEEALGGLLRSKQVVVVGDAKQLPPTEFFNRSTEVGADEEFEDIDDESILETCEKTFHEVRPLKWHYRSRCESLIAFSNAEFYNNTLVTFPTARPRSFSIDLIRVEGAYRARRNVAEASRVAEEAIELMRHFAEMPEAVIPTLGIVSVNIEQRDLIQEELRRLAAGDELIEQYNEKVRSKGEPLFVKNLENVQGDERDYIFISLTYGREPGATALKQRFGPINGKQGHRRLNVLFSRARIRIALFASFGSADVKPADTSWEGVRVLKRYLEYAENRGRAPVEGVGNDPDSDFELEVSERLRSRGYEIDFQVGVSGYKIDLGVRHPDHRETFLAGIECDGARYHSSASARDRDRLREEVLRGLGWDILRVWSTDWFDNPDAETNKLVSKLEQLRSKPPHTFQDYSIREPDNGTNGTESSASNYGAVDEQLAKSGNEESLAAATASAIPGQEFTQLTVLTSKQAAAALRELRDTVIRNQIADWEPHRSILRDGMIETFVAQKICDPEDWFRKVPQFQRSATNPVEKNLFLNQICQIIERIADDTKIGDTGFPASSPKSPTGSVVEPQPNSEGGRPNNEYVAVNAADLPVAPRSEQFYEFSYKATLGHIASHIIQVEGPIYDEVLCTRIARIHGFQKTGANIQKLVIESVDDSFPRTSEVDGREVFWRVGSRTDLPVPYRASTADVRQHTHIPIAELASLALPFIRIRLDEELILRKMADHFGLERLRDATRSRFQKAILFARAGS